MMEEFGSTSFDSITIIRKKRTQASRRPRLDSQPTSISRVSSISKEEDEKSHKKIKRDNEQRQNGYTNNNKRHREGVLSLAKMGITNGLSDKSGEARKVRLKVGGVSRTIHGSSSSKTEPEDESRLFNEIQQRKRSKVILQANSDDIDISPSEERKGFQDPTMKKTYKKGSVRKQGDKSESSRKGKRVSKKRYFDDDDSEIQYLEKLKNIKTNNEESNKKHLKISTRSTKSIPEKKASDETDYDVENELGSVKEIALTTRQRALHLRKDVDATPGASLEFPNGLPPAPSRKQKQKLTEAEQQLKKAEAAQKRKAQNEIAARELEAEAIRKILGQDSNRKKRGDKIKKRQEEIAKEKAANDLVVPPNTIRTVISPTGTTVTFSSEIGLPSLFNSKTCSYPAPREKCAGPACTNPYKYRDSKSKLPLCSLQCYKAVQEKEIPAV